MSRNLQHLTQAYKGGKRTWKKWDHFPREPNHPPIEEVTLEDWLATWIVTGSSHPKRLCTNNNNSKVNSKVNLRQILTQFQIDIC